MKFTVSTKPLKDSLNLCIINANVQNFYTKSKLVQLTADAEILRINHAADSILSEVRLKGLADGESASIMVDPLLLKDLIATFKSPQVTFEFTENVLIIHAGKSSYSLPKLMDTSEARLPTPKSISKYDVDSAIPITKSDWKFIKDHQMFAKSDSKVAPVYMYVWVGKNGDVLVGDYVESLFTYSTVSNFGRTCLLKDTIINLFNSLPENAKLISHESSYSVSVSTDGFEYLSDFTPMYESETVGDYNSEIIIAMMNADDSTAIKVNAIDINTVLGQSKILTSEKNPIIECTIEKNVIRFKDNNMESEVVAEGGPDNSYTLRFKPDVLKSVISNCPESIISISPTINEGEVVGIIIASGGLKVVLAGIE